MKGLEVRYDALDEKEQARLLMEVLASLKSVPLLDTHERSRVKRWGWDYLKTDLWLEDAPGGIYVPPRIVPEEFESVTVNEYAVSHGLGAHIDSEAYGEPIVVMSLGATATMRFERGEDRLYIPLRPGTEVRMRGPARWEWKHGMEPDNQGVRWSVVYRHKIDRPPPGA